MDGFTLTRDEAAWVAQALAEVRPVLNRLASASRRSVSSPPSHWTDCFWCGDVFAPELSHGVCPSCAAREGGGVG